MPTRFSGHLTEDIRAIHLEADPRFSYSLIMPRELDDQTRLVVVVHGSERDPIAAMTRFRELALWCNAVILAPMFPRFPNDAGDLVGYKILRWDGINYDEILFAMVQEAHERYGVPLGRFALSGYSGGGQFVERFALFHAQHLLCAAIGAPGRVTLPTSEHTWWVGVGNTQEQIGMSADLEALRMLPIQLVVGALDIGEGYPVPRESGIWRDDLELAGSTRLERATTLYQAFRDIGAAEVRLDVVDDQAHECPGAFEVMKTFIAQHLVTSRRK
ncbi:hypothetical protein [Microbacterium sp. YY-01]|uniref:hypothetical protein n=1 Tax=Microbacterium sp. YY-01 TaxID=3421634 RepID=UPI003D17BA15